MIDMDGEEINTDKFIECTKAALQAVDRLTGAINALKKLCGKEKRKVSKMTAPHKFVSRVEFS